MLLLVIGLLLFFAVHSIAIINEPFRNNLVRKYGEGLYKGIFSLISLVSLALIIWGYGLARYEPVVILTPPQWLRHLSLLLMIPVFPLLLAAYLPGRIKLLVKHPMLIAVKLWALAHLLANGMLADLVLFGGFLAWAVVDRISLKRRETRGIPSLPNSKFNDWIAVTAGLALYFVFAIWLHLWLIGIAPIAVSR